MDEEELWVLFESESRDRLARLRQGLIKLTDQPDHAPAVLEGLFREAHSLKGAAHMLELGPLETVTHRLEELLGHLKRGRMPVTPEVVEKLQLGVEATGKLCREAVARAARSEVDLAAVLTAMEGGDPVLPGVAKRAKRVLLVEDSLLTRAQEKRILEAAGYEVTEAVDGADGWEKLTLLVFDAVVSDIEMPNMDGLTFTRRIRENPRYKELPVILVTGLAAEEDRQRGLEVGADAYLSKRGLGAGELLEALARLT